MSTQRISTAAELSVMCNAILVHRNGLDERMPVVRRGERKPIHFLARQLIYRRDGWCCVWCGKSPYKADSGGARYVRGPLHIDHIVPWSANGSDRSDNLRTLCAPCNEWRSNFRVDVDNYAAIPVVRICDPCRGARGDRPESAHTVYCGARPHEGWVTDEALFL